jgi:tRNA(Arg) A34 adenosine deaminase TadA
MCMAALHWARVGVVFFGATIADAASAGFNELELPAADLLRLGKSGVELVPGVLPEECRALFAEWSRGPLARSY